MTKSTVNDYIGFMFHTVFILCCLIWPFFSPQTSLAFETKGQDCSKCHTLNQTEATDLLNNLFPDIKVLNISMSPSKGLWEVYGQSGGKKGIFYVDFAKKHAFLGSMISIAEKKNLSQERLSELNKIDVSQIPLQDTLVMGDPNAKFKVIVFDDPDWPFCAKLHQEMKKTLEERKDIVFYIKLYPLKIHPEAYEKSKAIVCEKSLALLEAAHEKKPLPKSSCETTVIDENIKLAEKLGITSLPSIVLPDGRVFPGYRDAKSLIELIAN